MVEKAENIVQILNFLKKWRKKKGKKEHISLKLQNEQFLFREVKE